jgi:hypothetical protein
MGMKDIPTKINGKAFTIYLIKDIGTHALYLNLTDQCVCGWEVHKIRIKEAGTKNINGRKFTVPKRRVIASTSEFGKYGWSYPNLKCVEEEYPSFFPLNINENNLIDQLIASTKQRKIEQEFCDDSNGNTSMEIVMEMVT